MEWALGDCECALGTEAKNQMTPAVQKFAEKLRQLNLQVETIATVMAGSAR